jgi:hypothetical protein
VCHVCPGKERAHPPHDIDNESWDGDEGVDARLEELPFTATNLTRMAKHDAKARLQSDLEVKHLGIGFGGSPQEGL